MSTIGFITMAYGPDKYLRQAETLARSVKRNMPGHKIAIISDRTCVSPVFDLLVSMNERLASGVVHKLSMYDYSPFEETLFIDSDCIVIRSFENELREISKFEFSPIVRDYLGDGQSDLWLEDVGKITRLVGGKSFPKFNGGVYYFRKGPLASEVFRRSRDMLARAEKLGIRFFDASGPNEETLLGLALSSLGAEQLYFDHGRLMRTPLNSRGHIVADPIAGICHFEKDGEQVQPAIIHYCGEYIDHPTYVIAQRALLRGKALATSEKLLIEATYRLSRFVERVTNRLRRLERRRPAPDLRPSPDPAT